MIAIRVTSSFQASSLSRRAALSLTAGTCAAAALVSPRTVLAAMDDPAILAFRDEVVAVLRGDFPKADIVLDPKDPEQILIGRFTLFLGNLRGTVVGLRGEARRAMILDRLGRYATATPVASRAPEPFMQAGRRLRLQLFPNEYRDQAPDLVCRRFSEKLLVAYALDEPKRYQMVTRPIFEPWGVDQSEVERIAAENLRQDSDGLEVNVSPTGRVGRFATLASEDGYVAARLLIPTVMNQIREGLKTPAMVVAVPTRDILVAWSPDSEARRKLAALVTEWMHKGPYGRSTELFHSSADGLRPLDPAEMFAYRA